MNGYPDGCTQADHDRAFGELSTEPDDDVVRLDCGCYGVEDAAMELGAGLVCLKCYERAEKIGQALAGLEIPALIDALKMYGPSRLGNHDLFKHLLGKLENAQKWQKQEAA